MDLMKLSQRKGSECLACGTKTSPARCWQDLQYGVGGACCRKVIQAKLKDEAQVVFGRSSWKGAASSKDPANTNTVICK